jgi:hypothetical protein
LSSCAALVAGRRGWAGPCGRAGAGNAGPSMPPCAHTRALPPQLVHRLGWGCGVRGVGRRGPPAALLRCLAWFEGGVRALAVPVSWGRRGRATQAGARRRAPSCTRTHYARTHARMRALPPRSRCTGGCQNPSTMKPSNPTPPTPCPPAAGAPVAAAPRLLPLHPRRLQQVGLCWRIEGRREGASRPRRGAFMVVSWAAGGFMGEGGKGEARRGQARQGAMYGGGGVRWAWRDAKHARPPWPPH